MRQYGTLSPLGKFIKKLFIDRELTNRNAAELLDIGCSLLSYILTGKRAITKNVMAKIIGKFELQAANLDEFKKLAEQQNADIKTVTRCNYQKAWHEFQQSLELSAAGMKEDGIYNRLLKRMAIILKKHTKEE